MPERQYRPGSRQARFRSEGRMSENRYAWLRTIIGQFTIMLYDSEEQDPDHEGPVDKEALSSQTVRLLLQRVFGKPISYNLSALTHEEFVELKRFFTLLFEIAEPIVLERDRIANEALANGDDSYSRVYRQVPQFIVRGRPGRPNGEGVHNGPANAPAGHEAGLDSSGETGGDSGGVADDNEEDRLAEDDNPTDHQPSSVREVGGDGPSADGLPSSDTSQG